LTGAKLILGVRGDPDQVRQALMQRLSTVDPALGAIRTLRTVTGMAAFVLQVAFFATIVLGALALMLTLSGLFSVLSYLVAQRTKQLGVRIALGATRGDVARLVLWQSMGPVGLGLLTGVGLAGAVAIAQMSTPAAGQIAALVHVYDPLPYVATLFCIAVTCALAAAIPALRAARIDPIASLREL
jgi:putative ABC transport system permease protein